MESQNYAIPVQDSMGDSEITDSFMPDLTSSFESKYKNKQSWDEQSESPDKHKWIMEDYPEDKIHGTPQKKNHSTTLYENKLYVFGGYDGKKNHNAIKVFNIDNFEWSDFEVDDYQPNGRNGHTATLIDDKIYIIGGWLGSGPFAADDLHVLDIKLHEWVKCSPSGDSPGP